jgi:glycosidase
VANQTDDPESLLSHYRNLIHLRNSFPALQNGKMVILDSGSSRLWAILRYTEEETALVLVNLSTRPQSRYGLTLYNGPSQTLSPPKGFLTQRMSFYRSSMIPGGLKNGSL